ANGVFRPELSRLAAPLARFAEAGDGLAGTVADGETRPLVALNEALARDGYVLRLPAGTVIEEPIEVVHVATGGAAHLRNLVALGRGARATIVERHLGLGDGESVANLVTEVDLAADAKLRIWR